MTGAVSGPVTTTDASPEGDGAHPSPPTFELTEDRTAQVGSMPVRRALPRRGRRTVGAWCFLDHLGPTAVDDRGGAAGIGPHPHIGLQTVTWLVAGEVLHRDSLGSEQVVRPGQLNLMTAGHGVAHAEEGTGRYRGDLHGVQLWVAQPDASRHGPAAFEHHAELPVVDLPGGAATVLVGALGGTTSPARRDTDHFGVDLVLTRGSVDLPLRLEHEHALVVLDGAVSVAGHAVVPGSLAYLGSGRDELRLAVEAPARALLVGGVPFAEPVLMWWNFVARTREEITDAYRAWGAGKGGRFAPVRSNLDPIPVDPPPWVRPDAGR